MGFEVQEIHAKNFNPSLDLIIADFIMHSNYYSIPLKHFNTDKEKKDAFIIISQTNKFLSPVLYGLLPVLAHTCKRKWASIFYQAW